jgi:serine/threonine-protein kinase
VCARENSSQLYVLKEFAPTDSRESVIEKCRALFEQEAQVLCKLKHSQIPQCFGCFEDNGRLFLVQEYIDGKTYSELLQERLEQGQVFTVAQAVKWLKDLLPVLDYIHSCRIVHRDISPDNIMFPHGGKKPVLIDFGVVKQVMTQIGSQISSPPSSSVRGTLVGKVGYSPPEQLRLGQCYPNSDLYSLAVTALVLIAGKHPSELCDGYSLKWQWSKYVNLGDTLGQIFDKMLAETPKDRYQSARAVLAALATVSTEELANASTAPIVQDLPQTLNEDDTWVARSYARRLPIAQKSSQPKRNTIIQSQRTVIQAETKKTSVKLAPPPPSMRFLAMGILISSSLVGGFTLAKQSSNLAVVCELFNNCANNQPLEAIAREPIPTPKDTSEVARLKQSEQTQDFPTPFVETSQSDRTESSDRQQELLDKIQSLQSQVAQLLERNYSTQPETVEKIAPKNEPAPQKPEKETKQATSSRPSASPSPPSERNLSEKLLNGARSILTSQNPQPLPRPPQPTRSIAQSNPTPTKKAQTPAPEPTPTTPAPEPKPTTPQTTQSQTPAPKPATPQTTQSQTPAPKPTTPQNATPAPRTKKPPAQTYHPGFWQPVARINPKHPFKIKLVNQTNAAIEYALTTNEFPPRQLSSKESALLTHVPLDGYILINSAESSPNAVTPKSLQFEVTVSGNVATVLIRQERSDRPADSTINVNQSGAIYIF